MGLMTNVSDVQASLVDSGTQLIDGEASQVETKVAFGGPMSLHLIKLPPGYRSRPNVQDCEQIGMVVGGELWFVAEQNCCKLRAGDFFRIPEMAITWFWNESDGSAALHIFSSSPKVGDPEIRATAAELLSTGEDASRGVFPSTVWLSSKYSEAIMGAGLADSEGPLVVRAADVTEGRHRGSSKAGQLFSKFVFGKKLNLMLAKRDGDYHSLPHIHACDQLNYLMEGELWIFLNDAAYYLRPGDIMRVPKMVPHWAWNPGAQPCLLLEGHSPTLDPYAKPFARSLLDPDEGQPAVTVKNLYLPESLAERELELIRHPIRTGTSADS